MSETIRVRTIGNGYEAVEFDGETYSSIPHHRVLSFAWGDLDSPFFEEDPLEVHHRSSVVWDNRESNLEAVSPREHREIDPRRAGISTPWDQLDRETILTDGGDR